MEFLQQGRYDLAHIGQDIFGRFGNHWFVGHYFESTDKERELGSKSVEWAGFTFRYFVYRKA